jgi:hypothetical protein
MRIMFPKFFSPSWMHALHCAKITYVAITVWEVLTLFFGRWGCLTRWRNNKGPKLCAFRIIGHYFHFWSAGLVSWYLIQASIYWKRLQFLSSNFVSQNSVPAHDVLKTQWVIAQLSGLDFRRAKSGVVSGLANVWENIKIKQGSYLLVFDSKNV